MDNNAKELDLSAVWRVIEKFKESVMRLGLNLYDQFKRFDPSGEQLISEYFFRKVLEVVLKNEVPLSEDEIRILVNYFQYRDGRIMYSEMCDRVHDKCVELSTMVKANLVTGLEWEDPLHINALKPDEESRLVSLLNRIANALVYMDHPIDMHFKEYDQIARNPGCVSLNHLARIFKTMSINLSEDDFNLLVKRYVRHNFMFNYIPFLDELNTAIKCLASSGAVRMDIRYVLNAEPEKVKRPDIQYPKCDQRGKEWGLPVSFTLLSAYKSTEEGPHLTMKRIKKHIFTNGIDLRSIFQDLDRYRTGVVSNYNFRRGLTNSGINVGVNSKLTIKEEDINQLMQIYSKPYEKGQVMWKLFVNDVDSGLLKHEVTDEKYDEGSDLRFLPAQGNKWNETPEEVRILCEETLERLRSFLKARRWAIKPFFIEWDKSSTGHVNISIFRNILSTNEIVTDPKELDAIEKRYANAKGFDYQTFIDELRCDALPDENKSSLSSKTSSTKSIASMVDPCHRKEYTDAQIADAIRRIRKQIVVNSRKLDDYFKQWDPINKFTVSKYEFLRVLATNNIDFTEDEGEILISTFKAPLQDRVDYKRFLEMIDEAYTQKDLDKAPLIVPVKHIPVIDMPDRFLNIYERRLVESALEKLSKKVNMLNYDDAKDYDRSKAGDWTSNQFIKFLDRMRVRLTKQEIAALTKAFGRTKGGLQYLEYLPLLNAVDILYKLKRDNS